MDLIFQNKKEGLEVSYKNKNFRLKYPGGIWKNYPEEIKEVLIDNLSHLITINSPLIANIRKVKYNTSLPLFKSLFNEVILKSIPHAIEDYKDKKDMELKVISDTDNETIYLIFVEDWTIFLHLPSGAHLFHR